MINVLSRKLSGLRAALNILSDSDYLSNIALADVNVELDRNAFGAHTLFDPYLHDAWQASPPPIDVECLSRMCVSDATLEFTKRLIKLEHKQLAIPVRKVEAIGASKSDLRDFRNAVHFGQHNFDYYRKYYQHLSLREYFSYCLNNSLTEGSHDFSIKLWAPMLMWSNNDGSHRFATACFIADTEKYDDTIESKASVFALNHDWLDEVRQIYDGYLLMPVGYRSFNALHDLFKIYDPRASAAVTIRFGENLKVSDPLHQSGTQSCILLLRRDSKLSRPIKKWLDTEIETGKIKAFFDLTDGLRATEYQCWNRLIS